MKQQLPAFLLLLLCVALFPASASSVSAFSTDNRALPGVAQHRKNAEYAEGTINIAAPPLQGHAGPEFYSLSVPMHPLIEQEYNRYTGGTGRKFLERVLVRAEPYRDYISRKLDETDMPPELVFLPVIESAYVSRAYSPAGAAGLWQFIPSTARLYGLRMDSWHDQRRDFVASTDAAIRFLSRQYERFDDWLLALAAYNCGPARVSRSIRAAGTTDFWELSDRGYLPAETVHYVPRFLAVSSLLTYAGRNGFSLDWEPAKEWVLVKPGRTLSIDILASKAGVPASELYRGNRELYYGITPEHSGYRLKVPVQYAPSVTKALSSGTGPFMRFHIYYVKSGDTLSELAEHYGVNINMIYRYNRVSPTSLQIGRRLIIPALHNVGEYPGSGRETTADDPRDYTNSYTVREGDTLWDIAMLYDTTPEILARKNRLSVHTTIHPGMKLSVPAL
ncbi:MAG: LysM peptidoglycan-binding domain-containing protein [Spirochaetales bacterium]|nr:LysM peptidoglycan-binding domain-containing protein [Spirochaetales bacterium]MCF7937027.1 LysM peptidoglycan-binding domain-containing protein [Spirochaetales bacterium]